MKKQVFVQVFLFMLMVAILLLIPVNAQTPPPTPTPQNDPTSSMTHGDEIIVYDVSPQQVVEGTRKTATEDILLIQTSDPWESSSHYVGNNWYDGITSDTMVLNSLGYSYRIATWNDINSGAVNIFAYPVVLIVNDQVQAFYDSYAAHITDFENYVSSGHTLLFFAAGYGWAGGELNATLPGGLSWNLRGDADVAWRNTIVNSSHPIVSAQLSNRVPLNDNDLYSNYCSHGWFSNLPAGTNVILRESVAEGNNPTLIEYHLGNGRVIASTLTWEHNWSYHTGADVYGTFAHKALDDVFLYALSGGTVPADVKLDLRIEDAPAWIDVNKSGGSYVDVVARVTGDSAYEANVILQVPSDKFGAPAKTFTRNRSGDPVYGKENQYVNLGGGQYQITGTLQSLAGQYYKELVWRFKVPDGATPEQGIELSATVSVPDHTVQNPTSKAKLNIIDYARSILVTNRRLLFSKYQLNPTQNDVSSLLEEVYIQAWAYDGEVFYVDLYNDTARDWSQNVNYTSETTANTVAITIDGLIDGWYNRLTKQPHWWETIKPEFLLIVGGDEIIPFYRADDRPYGDDEHKYVHIDDNDPVGMVPQQHYLLSDNIYADVGGGKSDWEKGNLELSTGRIIGHSAAAMRHFIENAWLETPPLTHAVLASMGGSQVDGMLDRLNNRHINIIGVNNPDMTDNDDWSRNDWLTAWQGNWQLNYYGGHGAYNQIPGPNPPGFTQTITTDELPDGNIATNHPLFIADACNLGIPTDVDGAIWSPEANDNVMYKMVSQEMGGMVASTGISSYGPWILVQYGEWLINNYVEHLIDKGGVFVPARSYSEYWGTALLKAKQDYSGGLFGIYDGTDKKTMMEYVYYGLPWSFMEMPDNQTDRILTKQQAIKDYALSVDTPQKVALNSHSKILTATVTSHQFVPVAGFELLDISGSDSLYSVYKPVLPIVYTTFNLPPGATLSSIELVSEHSTALGQHNIPAADPPNDFHSTTGYTSTMDVSGVYPPTPRYGYETRDLGDRVEVRIAIAPATFDIGTRNVNLYDSTVLKINYNASIPVAISPLALNKPEYQVGESITSTANIENVGANPVTLTAKVSVYNVAGDLVGTIDSSSFDIAGGESYNLQIPWTTILEPGNYRTTLSVEQSGTPQVTTSASFGILAGKLSAFSAPQVIDYDEYGSFSLSFENYRSTPITATAKVYVYNSAGIEVVNLLQRTFTVNADAIGTTSWYWNPAGLPRGAYTVRAVAQVGDETYTSSSYNMQVRKPVKVYLPDVLKNFSGSQPPSTNNLSGIVTDNGNPVVGAELSLRYYNGSSYSTYATTSTDANGNYQFTNLPTLGSGQGMYVRWYNDDNNVDRLSSWSCWYIDSDTTDTNAYQCDFDLKDVVLVSPAGGSTITLPYSFYWTTRGITTDSYELDIADRSDYDPYWWADFGYTDHYTMNSLPDELSINEEYGWWMWVYGSDGYGISYYYRNVIFSNTGNMVSSERIPTTKILSKENFEMTAPMIAK